MPCVVFYALAGADLSQHLHVVSRSLFNPLGFQQLAPVLEPLDPLFQFLFDGHHGLLHILFRGHVMGCRIDGHVLAHSKDLAGDRVHLFDRFHLIAEKFDPDRFIVAGRIDVDDVAADPEGAALKTQVIAGVLNVDQPAQDVLPRFLHARPQRQHLVLVVERAAQSVDAGHAGHDDDVTPFEQSGSR